MKPCYELYRCDSGPDGTMRVTPMHAITFSNTVFTYLGSYLGSPYGSAWGASLHLQTQVAKRSLMHDRAELFCPPEAYFVGEPSFPGSSPSCEPHLVIQRTARFGRPGRAEAQAVVIDITGSKDTSTLSLETWCNSQETGDFCLHFVQSTISIQPPLSYHPIPQRQSPKS